MNDDATTPAAPKVVTRKKPIEEQLAHMLETVPSVEPEKKDVPNLNL